jgi:hypothetical protein
MGLMGDLGSGPIGVATAIFNYFIEAASVWLPLITKLFRAAANFQLELVTSSVTLPEMPVVPFRANNDELAARYEALLTSSRGIRLIDVTRDQLRLASRLCAMTGMRTPDALQLIPAARRADCYARAVGGAEGPPSARKRLLGQGRGSRDFDTIADDVIRQFRTPPSPWHEIIRRQRDRPDEKAAQDVVVGQAGEDTADVRAIREIAVDDGDVIVAVRPRLAAGAGTEQDQLLDARKRVHNSTLVVGEPVCGLARQDFVHCSHRRACRVPWIMRIC